MEKITIDLKDFIEKLKGLELALQAEEKTNEEIITNSKKVG